MKNKINYASTTHIRHYVFIQLRAITLLVYSFFILPPASWCQQKTPLKNETGELLLKLNEDGSHYIRATILGQVWLRYNQSNPGSAVLKDTAAHTVDIGIRRLRFQLMGQLTDHSFFYIQFGQDNFNFAAQRKFIPFFQDVQAEYKIKKGSEAVILGAGLSAFSGLSRLSQPQLPNSMTMDLPGFVFPTFELTDQAGRRLGAYVRGQAGKLDYRIAINDPFSLKTNGGTLPGLSANGFPLSPNADMAQQGHHFQYNGLVIWNFFDREPHTVAYMPGTYYGKKKVFNLESGFVWQKNAAWSSADGGQTVQYHSLRCWSASIFYDAPLQKEQGTALSIYAGYFNTWYGPGYLRYIGVMNPADGLSTSSLYPVGSQGNAFPANGTGHVLYAQIGYLLQKDLLGKDNGKLMLYGACQNSRYERIDKDISVFTVGINWLLQNNASKLSIDYQNRPVFNVAGNKLMREVSRKGQVVLQYQFFF